MLTITNFTDKLPTVGKHSLEKDNIIIKETAELNNSKIIFRGPGNIFYLENDVKMKNSTINFIGNNSIVYLSSNKFEYRLSAVISIE